MLNRKKKITPDPSFRDWAPDLDRWPTSWMGVKEDLEYGMRLLPYFEHFLQELYDSGLSRRTFVKYRNDLWLLGGTIVRQVSNFEEYHEDPLEKLYNSVIADGILPYRFDRMCEADLNAFFRMCRKLEKFLDQHYGSLVS